MMWGLSNLPLKKTTAIKKPNLIRLIFSVITIYNLRTQMAQHVFKTIKN